MVMALMAHFCEMVRHLSVLIFDAHDFQTVTSEGCLMSDYPTMPSKLTAVCRKGEFLRLSCFYSFSLGEIK